jgi:hypothetical protein
VTFYDGATQIGSGTVSAGVATFTTSALATLANSITAVYSGDSSYGPATSGALSEMVEDFTLAPLGGGTANVPAGSVASYPLAIAPVGGATLPGAVTFSVTGLSLDSTAGFSPATVTAGSGASTVTGQGGAATAGPALWRQFAAPGIEPDPATLCAPAAQSREAMEESGGAGSYRHRAGCGIYRMRG